MSSRFALLAALALGLSACASDSPADDAVVPAPDAADLAETAADTPEPDAEPLAEADETEPAEAPTPDAVSETDATPAPEAGGTGGNTLTVINDTGMTIEKFHMVNCDENEGEDWDLMQEWAYDYLTAPLAPGAQAEIEIAASCLVTLPVWEDGTAVREKVLMDGDTTHSIMLG